MTRVLSILLLLAGIACTRFEEPAPVREDEQAEVVEALAQTRSGAVTVYEKLSNPYSLEVMQAVYDSLSINPVVLQPTDYYVRIRPQNGEQLNWLWNESGLELFGYPLDIKIPEGQKYIDPTIHRGELGWLYTTIKPNFTFSAGYVYEFLEDLYIPDSGQVIETRVGTRAGEGNAVVNIERAALRRMGYVSDSIPPPANDSTRVSGMIRVWDDVKSEYVGLKGIKIRSQLFTIIHTTYTDQYGYYEFDIIEPSTLTSFFINFDNDKSFSMFDAPDNVTAVEYSLGCGIPGDVDITPSDTCWKWAVVNNSAFDYIEKCGEIGIAIPPEDLRILILDYVKWGSAPMLHRIERLDLVIPTVILGVSYDVPVSIWREPPQTLGPDVIIGTLEKDTYRKIFELVNHELSHTSHFSQVCRKNTDYWEKYINFIVINFIEDDSTTYGKTGTGIYSQICGIGEMWAYAMGHILEHEYYYSDVPISMSYHPYEDAPGTDGCWIKPHVIWDIYRYGLLTKKEIFNCLTEEVDSYNIFIEKMWGANREKAADIVDIFNTYGIGYPLNLTNTTITSDHYYFGHSIYVRNVSVMGGAKLSLIGPSVTIDQPFIVDRNSEFEITF